MSGPGSVLKFCSRNYPLPSEFGKELTILSALFLHIPWSIPTHEPKYHAQYPDGPKEPNKMTSDDEGRDEDKYHAYVAAHGCLSTSSVIGPTDLKRRQLPCTQMPTHPQHPAKQNASNFPSNGMLATSGPLILDRRARDVTVRAIDAAVSLLRFHLECAVLAGVDVLAGIRWHRLS
jgi:hypothetical protein